jgi:hypothetical protein
MLAEFDFSATGPVPELRNDIAKPQPFDSSRNKIPTY